ncbi:hypothetical protein OS493_037449 [Desmophyllum pertusum]|uniref:Uncharacterized protein n=1 Tax=Desmophyllum pertusum TaxID=174260 RepID=A0A9X0CC74_9CNID|nr:hypothetical protein OS493_037449 [Desmophyllum pertusum]
MSKRWVAYTLAEDQAINKFVRENPHLPPKGINLWKLAVDEVELLFSANPAKKKKSSSSTSTSASSISPTQSLLKFMPSTCTSPTISTTITTDLFTAASTLTTITTTATIHMPPRSQSKSRPQPHSLDTDTLDASTETDRLITFDKSTATDTLYTSDKCVSIHWPCFGDSSRKP